MKTKTNLIECPRCHTMQFDNECAHCATKAERHPTHTPTPNPFPPFINVSLMRSAGYSENAAAYIVRAVNAHEALLLSLKRVTKSLETHILDQAKLAKVPTKNFCPCFENELAEAVQAIAKAEAK